MTATVTTATRITLFRVLLVPCFIGCLLYYRSDREFLRWAALFLFCLGAVTDGIDGFIARRFSQHSALGKLLDPLADKLLLLSAFVCLSVLDLPPSIRIPPWATLVVLSRDLMIIVGSCLIYLLTQTLEIRPSRLGKIATFLQMASILFVLANLPFKAIVLNASVGFTVASGIGYLKSGSDQLNRSLSDQGTR